MSSGKNNEELGNSRQASPKIVPVLGAVTGLITAITLLIQALFPNGIEGFISMVTTGIRQGEIQVAIPDKRTLGWIRLGAIKSTSLKDGVPLIATSQPVTIQPTVVPRNDAQVIIATPVNVRDGAPELPDYDPEKKKKITILTHGAKIVITQKTAFPDPKRSDMMIVWAEVRLVGN